MHDAVTQWAKMKQSIASNRQLNKFRAATVVFDSKSGQYYYGMNRGIRMKGDMIDGQLAEWLPKETLCYLPVGNCAEVDAVNQALKANINDLYLYTIDVENYLPKAMCDNCIYTFADKVAEVFSH